jgi:hypothetical protein
VIFEARSVRVFVWSRPVDFRKGVNGLAALVSSALGENPYCGDVFVFRSKRKDRLKLLAWDGTGMILATKDPSSYYTSSSSSCVFCVASAFIRGATRSASVFHRLHCFLGRSSSGIS